MLVIIRRHHRCPLHLSIIPLHIGIAGAVELSLKVQYHILLLGQVERNNGLALHGIAGIGGNIEREVINHFADVGFPIGCEFFCYTL